MKLSYKNEVDTNIVSSSSAQADYPITNVQHQHLTKVFKSEVDNVSIDIDSSGSLQGIYEEYTNLVQDPTDLTTANWVTQNGTTATATDITIDSLPLTKLEIDGTLDPQIAQLIALPDTETKKVAYFLLRNGNNTGTTTCYVTQNNSSIIVKAQTIINWSAKTVTDVFGTILKSNWLDDNTVEFWVETLAGELGHTTWQYRVDPESTGTGHAGEYIYATSCQLVEGNDNALVSSPIARYHLNGNAIDSVGSNDGTETDITYAAGENEYGAVFNGTSSNIVTDTLSDFGTSVSISLWLKVPTYTTDNYVFELQDSVNLLGMRAFRNATVVEFDMTGEIGNLNTPITDNTWTHFGFVLDGTSMSLYKDGALIITKTGLATFDIDNAKLHIGASAASSIWFDGMIDEVNIFDKALTADEVLKLYNKSDNIAGQTMFPFVNGTHSKDVITDTFSLPDIFVFDMIIEPQFSYDTIVSNINMFSFRTTVDNRLILFYDKLSDRFSVYWKDGGTGCTLIGYQFDNGTSYTKLNQRLRLTGFINLASGGQNDSRFIIVPLEEGSLYQDTSWNYAPDIKTTDFETLYIGDELSSNIANSDYEYLRFYGWDGTDVDTITSSEQIDNILQDMSLLFDRTYLKKITATDFYIANHNLSSGSKITLQASDRDSWESGTPLYETIEWDKDIINKTFAESAYSKWRLNISSNVSDISIGRLFLGESIILRGPHTSFVEKRINTSATTISISGQSYGDTGFIFKSWEMAFPYWDNTEKDDIELFADTVSMSEPFFVQFTDDNCNTLGPAYCIMTNTIEFTHLKTLDIWSSQISFREVK